MFSNNRMMAKHFRDRAEELLLVSENFNSEDCRFLCLKIYNSYMELADLIENVDISPRPT